MKKLSTEEVKKIQLEILDVVASFCEENGINYWIDCGTLLGAVRHKGYIPWDDDIDIGMLRPDYDRFRELFNQKNERYKFVCFENTPEIYLAFGKVGDTSTILREPYKNGIELNVNIDVFVYDNAPDDEIELKKMFDNRDRLKSIYYIQHFCISTEGNLIAYLLRSARKCFFRVFYPNITMKNVIDNSKKYANVDTKCVGNFTSETRMSCNKRVFDSFVDVEFEGKTYKAPIGYDEWLKAFFGDYMKLPPVEERVTHHLFEAFSVLE